MSCNINTRNFFGGFFGGVLGVIASSFISEFALPFGCIVGVVIGFWWQELGDVFKSAKTESLKIKRKAHLKKLFIHPTTLALRRVYVGRALAMVLVICLAYVLVEYREFEGFSTFIFIILIACFSLFFRHYLDSNKDCEINNGRFKNLNKIDILRKASRMKGYYGLWELNAKWGAWLIAREFVIMLGIACLMPVILLVLLVRVFISFIFGVSLIYVWMFGEILKGIYKIVTSKGHWTCVAVTVITTATMVHLNSGKIEGTTLWLSALLVGFVSGALSVIAHKLLKKSVLLNFGLTRFLVKPKISFKNWVSVHEDRLSRLQRLFKVIFLPPRYQYGVWKYFR